MTDALTKTYDLGVLLDALRATPTTLTLRAQDGREIAADGMATAVRIAGGVRIGGADGWIGVEVEFNAATLRLCPEPAETIPLRFAEPSAITFTYDAGENVAGDADASDERFTVREIGPALVLIDRVDGVAILGDSVNGALGDGLTVEAAERLPLASAILHRQPFGFTHDDLRTLDEAAEAEIGLQSCRGGPDTQAESDRLVDSLRSLKARIAVLLPTETT